MRTDPDLIELTVDGQEYVAIPRRLAGSVSTCIKAHITATAKAAGTDVPTEVPLWALSLQLALACRADSGTAAGSTVGADVEPPPLSVHDAARQLNITKRAVRAAALEGRLLGRQLGRFWTFRQADVDDYARRRASA